MDKVLVFGTKDCRLESCQGHAVGEQAWCNYHAKTARFSISWVGALGIEPRPSAREVDVIPLRYVLSAALHLQTIFVSELIETPSLLSLSPLIWSPMAEIAALNETCCWGCWGWSI